ncbi:MAG: hypothetical protein IJZ68_09425 [Bacteroidaceae bacterium]|nr:hypothetical protein [Bacteroidaceae bacterium]
MLKKAKYVTKNLACPCCGTKQNVKLLLSAQEYYLDGTPKVSMQDYVKQFPVCAECQNVYYVTDDLYHPIHTGITTALYPEEKQDMNKICERIAVCVPDTVPCATLILAHYEHECGNDDAANAALRDSITLLENQGVEYLTKLPGSDHMWKMPSQYAVIDAYRRLGDFEMANTMLTQYRTILQNRINSPKRMPHAADHLRFFELEESLIQAQCSKWC